MLESDVIAYLRRCGIDACAELPPGYAHGGGARAVTVERTGGAASYPWRTEEATLAVQSWAPTAFEAAELAAQVDRAMAYLAVDVPAVSRCERTSLYRYDIDTSARYQGVYDIVYYLEA